MQQVQNGVADFGIGHVAMNHARSEIVDYTVYGNIFNFLLIALKKWEIGAL